MRASGLQIVELPITPHITSETVFRPVQHHWERRAYFALRQQVFCEEQKLALQHEQDEHDFVAIAIVALTTMLGIGNEVAGGVRIYQTDAHSWFGGRLCVAPAFRHGNHFGKKLINEAVSQAKDLGALRFFANIQQDNVEYFARLHWHPLFEFSHGGKPHVRMQVDLSQYPICKRRQ